MLLKLYVDEASVVDAVPTSALDLALIRIVKSHLQRHNGLNIDELVEELTACATQRTSNAPDSDPALANTVYGQCHVLHYLYALSQLCTTDGMKKRYDEAIGRLIAQWGSRSSPHAVFLSTLHGCYSFLSACRDYFALSTPTADAAGSLTSVPLHLPPSPPDNLISLPFSLFKHLLGRDQLQSIPTLATLRRDFNFNCRLILHNFAVHQPYDTLIALAQLPTVAFDAHLDKMDKITRFTSFTPPTNEEAAQKLAELNALVLTAQPNPSLPIITQHPSQFSTHPLLQPSSAYDPNNTTTTTNHNAATTTNTTTTSTNNTSNNNNNNINNSGASESEQPHHQPQPHRFPDFLSFLGFDTMCVRQIPLFVASWELIIKFERQCLQMSLQQQNQLDGQAIHYSRRNPWNPHRVNALLDRFIIIAAVMGDNVKANQLFCPLYLSAFTFSSQPEETYTRDELTPFCRDEWGSGVTFQLLDIGRQMMSTVLLHHPYLQWFAQDFCANAVHNRCVIDSLIAGTNTAQLTYAMEHCSGWCNPSNMYAVLFNSTPAPPLSLSYHQRTVAANKPMVESARPLIVTSTDNKLLSAIFQQYLRRAPSHTVRAYMSRIINESWDNVVVQHNDDGNYLNLLLLPYADHPEDPIHPYTHSPLAFGLLLSPFYLFSTVHSPLNPGQSRLEVDGDVTTNCTTLFKYVILLQDFLTTFPAQYSQPHSYAAAHTFVDRTTLDKSLHKFVLIYFLFHWVLAHSTLVTPTLPSRTGTTLSPTSTAIWPIQHNSNRAAKPTEPTAQHLINHLKQLLSTAATTQFLNNVLKKGFYDHFTFGETQVQAFSDAFNARPKHMQHIIQHYDISYPIPTSLLNDDIGDNDANTTKQPKQMPQLSLDQARCWLYSSKVLATIPLLPLRAGTPSPASSSSSSSLGTENRDPSTFTGIDAATSSLIYAAFQALMDQYNTKLDKTQQQQQPQPTNLHAWCSHTLRAWANNTNAHPANLVALMNQVAKDAQTPAVGRFMSTFINAIFVLCGVLQSTTAD